MGRDQGHILDEGEDRDRGETYAARIRSDGTIYNCTDVQGSPRLQI